MPVCITGMHRSGTSAVANVLRELGVFLGPPERLMPATVNNREGHWEQQDLVEINDELLTALGGTWDAPPAAPPGWETREELVPLSERARTVIADLAAEPVWGWKDPRCSLTLPFWLQLIEGLNVVVCVRNPPEVIASLAARDGLSKSQAATAWLAYARATLEAAPDDRSLFVLYDWLLDEPAREVERLAQALVLEPSQLQKARAEICVNAALRHHAAVESFEGVATDEIAAVFERLCELSEHHRPQRAPARGAEAELTAAREVLSETRERLYVLQDELTARTAAYDSLWAATKELERRDNTREAELAQTREERDRVQSDLERTERKVERARESLEKATARQAEDVRRHETEVARLRAQVDSLHNSWSFRVTRPLRRLSALVRRGGNSAPPL